MLLTRTIDEIDQESAGKWLLYMKNGDVKGLHRVQRGSSGGGREASDNGNTLIIEKMC